MKKLLALMLAAALALSLVACGGGGVGDTNTPSGGEDASQEEDVQLSELALAAIFATRQAKEYLDDNLKNPQSLVINSIKGGVREDLNYIFEIDYNAENSFGGSVRDQMYIGVAGNSSDGYARLNFGSDGPDGRGYTAMFYNELASLGEVVFGEPGTEDEEAIETVSLINPEDLAGVGIFDFDVDTILENL